VAGPVNGEAAVGAADGPGPIEGSAAATEVEPALIPDTTTAHGLSPAGTKGDTPWVNARFWLLQLIILALYLVRVAASVAFHLDAGSLVVEFSTLALFLVPVVYAALNYGFLGAVFTAGWVTILAVPRFISAVANGNDVAAWAELAQVVLLDSLAFLVGQRVTAERDARRIAESAQEAHRSAEALYRDLFDSNHSPILIVDGNGNVIETNASARRAFAGDTSGRAGGGRSPSAGAPVRLVDMIGPVASGHILTELISGQLPPGNPSPELDSDPERVEPITIERSGHPTLYRPTATMLGRTDGGARMQIVFEDVTAETRRHDLMEAYAARVVSGQEEERRHLAQELHDGPVQTLIHLCRQIDAVESPAPPGHGQAPPLGDLRRIAEDTIAELRSITKGLRPSILDDLGLVASIAQTLTDAGGRHRFETTFGVTGSERRLEPSVELALFRIAQEAISNIERHAAARRVAVGLDFEQLGLRLLVKDDGVGFDPDDGSGPPTGDSLGLAGMTERANLIGARLVIHSAAGCGTTVDVWVPATVID